MSILSLNSYENLLQKCEFEYEQLQSCKSHPEYDFILFNLVLGLNHLFECFLKEKTVRTDEKIRCVKTFNPFASPYDVSGDFKNDYKKLLHFPTLNERQEVIRKLCNKAKHFKKQSIESQDKNYTCLAGDDSMECGNPEAECGAFDHYLYFVEVQGKDTNLEGLIAEHLLDWRQFVNGV